MDARSTPAWHAGVWAFAGDERGGRDRRHQDYGYRTQLQRVMSPEKVPRSVTTLSVRGPSAWILKG